MYKFENYNGYLLMKTRTNLVIGEHENIEEEFLKNFTHDCLGLIFDISDTTYIDSSGISIILKFRKRLNLISKQLFLICENPRIEKVFKVSKIDKIINIKKNINEVFESGTNKKANPEFKLQEYKIVIPSEYLYINVVQEFTLKIMDKIYDFTKTDEYDIRMSLEEALANSIEHGYKDSEREGLVQVYVICLQDEIIIFIDDYGKGFDREKLIKKVDKKIDEPYALRGRGLLILEKIADEVYYDSIKNKGSSMIIAKKFNIKESETHG
ncbi:MAG: ATP-binding protein [Candidatus Muiribacteriota bacterium]